MKIIIKGQKPDTKMFEGKCDSCNSVMREKRGKLKVESDQRDWQEFAHARCPVCGSDFVMTPLKGEANTKIKLKGAVATGEHRNRCGAEGPVFVIGKKEEKV